MHNCKKTEYILVYKLIFFLAGDKIVILIYSYIEIIKIIDLNHYMICSINVKHINYDMDERKYTILFNFCNAKQMFIPL